ncbi:hypothetical protein Agub_g7844, partial [Astrephomene gubernaculifera]
MTKLKRRVPIVPKPKAVEYQQSNKKAIANKKTASVNDQRRESAQHGKSESVPGGRGHNAAKRSREVEPIDAANRKAKRHKAQGGNGNRHPQGAIGHQWQPISVVHQQAAFAVQRLLEADSQRKHGASLKSLTLAPHVVAKKATYAVTCQVLKFSRLLEQLDQLTQLSSSRPKLGKYVALVLVYELLGGEGLERKGQAERAVLAAEPELRGALEGLLREAGVQSMEEWLAKQQGQQPGASSGDGEGGGACGGGGPDVPHPRWVRVNTLKANMDDIVRQLDEHLLNLQPSPKHRQQSLKSDKQQPSTTTSLPSPCTSSAPCRGAQRDPLLPDLLALPPGTDLHDHPLVTRGSVVLQSKASCMPAHALAPQPGWTVVDCCAAPGNKTTHLAALMGNKGRVIAFDKDPRRLSRLQANAALTGAAGCIEARLGDFLATDPTAPEFAEVRGVLLDPSCSGSGTTFTRMDHLLPSYLQHRELQQQQGAAATGPAAPSSTVPPEPS